MSVPLGAMSDVPKGCISDVLQALHSLTSEIRLERAPRRPKFPFACRNGPTCAFLACKSCWFVHDGDEVEVMKCMPKGHATSVKCNSSEKTTPVSRDVGLVQCTAAFEEKLASIQRSMDTRLSKFESKVTCDFDSKIANLVNLEKHLVGLGADMSESWDAKLSATEDLEANFSTKISAIESQLVELQSRPATDVGKVIDAKLDVALQDFMKGTLQNAFQAAFEAFAAKIEIKMVEIQDQLDAMKGSDEIESGRDEVKLDPDLSQTTTLAECSDQVGRQPPWQ